jgi:diacylglycerol O-acyltransferase / wax synthase
MREGSIMVRELNRRLSISDASFLYVEKPNAPMHVGSCLIYDGYVSADALTRVLRERIHLMPRYRQKVVFPPFALAHPTWEDDPDFDVARHVRELTLPAPGDDRVLSEVGGQAYAPPLDRNRPLWQAIVFQGRADGNSAVVWKIHHAMVDGVSMVDLMMVLHDLKRDAPPPPLPDKPWQPQPIPDPVTQMQEAVRDQLTQAATRWTEQAFRWMRAPDARSSPPRMAPATAGPAPSMVPPPRVPFNAPLSTRRQFAWAEFPFMEIRAIRQALGGTINDVVLAVVAGALGRYLRAHGYRTAGVTLWAICPVSLRRPDERGALGNRVSVMVVPIYVGMDDPRARLAAEREAVEQLKAQDQAGAFFEMTELGNAIPPAWQALAAQVDPPFTLINTASSNVPGPQIPLYLDGHKLQHWCGLAPLGAGMGLFNGIISYNQTLAISATVDPVLVPDVWTYAGFLTESFAELRTAASRVAAPAA